MNTQTHEYECYNPEENVWLQEKASVIASGHDRWGCYISEVDKKWIWEPKEAHEIIELNLKPLTRYGGTLQDIENLEYNYTYEKRERKEERRRERIEQLMRSIPQEPEDFEEKILEAAAKEHYGFYVAKRRSMFVLVAGLRTGKTRIPWGRLPAGGAEMKLSLKSVQKR